MKATTKENEKKKSKTDTFLRLFYLKLWGTFQSLYLFELKEHKAKGGKRKLKSFKAADEHDGTMEWLKETAPHSLISLCRKLILFKQPLNGFRFDG